MGDYFLIAPWICGVDRLRLFGVYADSNGKQPEEDLLRYMLERMRANLKLDAQIWENMPAERPFTPTANDNGVVAFREYCLQFNPL